MLTDIRFFFECDVNLTIEVLYEKMLLDIKLLFQGGPFCIVTWELYHFKLSLNINSGSECCMYIGQN